MLKYLLDTNMVIYVIKRRPVEVLGLFNENAGRMAISAITLAELIHGAEKSTRVAQNLAVVATLQAGWRWCPTPPGPRSTTAPSGRSWNVRAVPSV